uniref:Reverse transcriptase domain-containing protein n=1 Tax=Fagus sylvatica TaxID=28930 RepID=A0A2N9G1B6_FAGSY
MTTSQSKVGSLVIKIDLEKAYDRLEWSFIRHTLTFFNFPAQRIDLIMSCITTSSLSVLVNGDRLEQFFSSRGIRQGDPLSAYIFILCMEYLAWLIQVEVNGGHWTGIKASRNGPSFTHQFFVDDLILFAKANRKSCQAIKKVLDTFCKALGQNINSAKSKVFLPPHASNASIDMVRRELGFGISKSFGKYLGVPIVVDGRDRRAFDFLVEKIQGKLAGWKSRTLSSYRLNREFLWGDTAVTKKLHLLNWKVVTRPKEEGGPLTRQEEMYTISDVRDQFGQWNLSAISFALSSTLMQTLQGIPRPFTPVDSDRQFWCLSQDGLFTCKSAYQVALNAETPYQSITCWKWIWKLNTIPRVISFLWLACHNRLLTKALLTQHHILQDNLCPLCKEAPETILHILRDCSKVQPIWT